VSIDRKAVDRSCFGGSTPPFTEEEVREAIDALVENRQIKVAKGDLPTLKRRAAMR